MAVSATFHRASTVCRPLKPRMLTVCDLVAPGCAPPSLNEASSVLPMKYSQVAVECRAVHVRRIRVTAGDKPDRVKNLTGLRSTVYGEGGKDLLIGGRNDDNLFGGPGADVLRGMDGNDFLHARDLGSEEGINCDGGSSPGDQDQADLDSWPQDPNPRGCELRTRR